jgi:RepB DNA-primase from phage plasmid
VSVPLPPRQGLVAFMVTLAGPEPAGLLELRHRRRDRSGMRQRFFDKPQAAAMAATVLSQTGDVYIGCAPRSERSGGKDAVRHGWTLWVDCDDPHSLAAVERFEPPPAIVVRTSARGAHAYWPLERPLARRELERANRRLARALGACESAVTNAAAVLRPPATLNWKYDPPAAVTLERYTGETFAAEQVTGGLPDPPLPRRRPARAELSRARATDPLLGIAPAVYVERLTGRQVRRDGKIACPFHRDAEPSLHVYSDHWTCYSARCWRGDRPNGGDIYNFAGQLWLTGQSSGGGAGRPLRGREFIEVRKRLLAMFFGDGAAGA